MKDNNQHVICFPQGREKKYRLLFGLRSRIEYLERIFKAKELLGGRTCGRKKTWLTIFDKCHNRLLNDLKNKIKRAGLTIEKFCAAVSIVYGDFSDRAAHSVPFPPEVKEADINEVIELLEVDNDENITKALYILTRKLSLVNDEDVDVSSEQLSTSDSNIVFQERRSSKSNDNGDSAETGVGEPMSSE